MPTSSAAERTGRAPGIEEMPTTADEAELLDALRAGDPVAATRLVDATYGVVFDALCRLCGDRDLAADLTQETYRKAWQSLADFAGRSRLSTWLYRIAYTTFLNHVRRPLRLVPLVDAEAVTVPDPAPAGEQELVVHQEHQRLRGAVLALDEPLRFAVTAHFWAELPSGEIARLEGVSGAAIRKRLAKALAILEVALQEVDR